jgi:diketogulonate reductase-like aldo/keto reductase
MVCSSHGSNKLKLFRSIPLIVLLFLALVFIFVNAFLPQRQQQISNTPQLHQGLKVDTIITNSISSNQHIPKNLHIFTPTEIPKTMLSAPGSPLIPRLLYGTAWKKERTKDLVKAAIARGFRAIDTACQPKHYSEPLVGDAVAESISSGVVTRQELFLQTKYTPVRGQDPHNIPYDPKLPLKDQVLASFAKSLSNLHTDYLDSLLIHSPLPTIEETMEVWRVFEQLHKNQQVRNIGISNLYDLNELKAIYEGAVVKPMFIQNRFYEKTNWDRDLRAFCIEKGIHYQSFWTLTANPRALASPLVRGLAAKYGKTPEQIFFNFMNKKQVK